LSHHRREIEVDFLADEPVLFEFQNTSYLMLIRLFQHAAIPLRKRNHPLADCWRTAFSWSCATKAGTFWPMNSCGERRTEDPAVGRPDAPRHGRAEYTTATFGERATGVDPRLFTDTTQSRWHAVWSESHTTGP